MRDNISVRRYTVAALLIASTLYISLVWLTVPYFQSSGGIALWHDGFAESLAKGNPLQYPPHLALPQGAPIVFGASITYLQFVIMRLFGVDGLNSYALVGSLFALIAVFGCYALTRVFGVGKLLSIALAIGFLSQVFFSLHIQAYGAAGFGFAMLPAFCAFYYYLLKMKTSILSIMTWSAITTVIMVFVAFLDGYTFIMVVSCGIALLAGHALFDIKNWMKYLVVFAVFISSTIIALVCYKLYVPDAGLPGYPLSIFALLSVHIPGLLWPTTGYSILYDNLGWSVARPVTSFAGAGLGNHETVFLSLIGVLCVFLSTFLRVSNTWRTIGLLLLLGGIIMSIGPVLPESNDYSPPPQMALAEREPLMTMPTYPLFALPGLDQMRATYRWVAVVKLGVWILVCLVCARIASSGKIGNLVAFALVLILLLEGSANPFRQWRLGETLLDMATNLKKDLVTDLKMHVPARSRLLVLPITNDFLVHSVVAEADIYAYNVGGDKNLLIAASQRPPAISEISKAGPCLLQNLIVGAKSDVIDVLAFRMFDSHRGRRGWIWPPSAAEMDENRRNATELSKYLPQELIGKGTYFWFVDARRLRESLPSQACH